ncbi:MAG: hypothetical protein OES99_03295, partial [Gammaproteobacteria bacterium]|nr:hypothetical protein [Gammaproteobacteria bacterium]
MTEFSALAPVYRTGRYLVLLLSVLGAHVAGATVIPPASPPIEVPESVVEPELLRPVVPLEAFFSDPEFSEPQLSPSGRQLAVLHETNGSPSRNLKVVDFDTNRARGLTAYAEHEVVWYVWLDEKRIAYRAEIPTDGETPATVFGSEWFNVVDLSVNPPSTVRFGEKKETHSRKRQATEQARWHSLRLLDPRPIDENHLLVTVRNDRLNPKIDVSGQLPASPHVYTDVATVNVKTGRIRRLAKNPGQVYHWLVDRNGDARIAMSLDEQLNVHVMHRQPDEREWHELYSFGYGETGIWPLAFAKDPNLVYVLSNKDRDTRALFTYDLTAGRLVNELFAHEEVDVSGILLSRDGSWAIGARYETDRPHIHYFDPYRQAIDTELANALSDYDIDVQFSDDSSIALVAAHNEKNPGRYYRFDADSGRLRELFRMRDFLPEQYLSPTKAIDLRARDGEQLHGFLTIPRGATGPSPMVVIVHGGPHEVRDSWES